MKTKLSHLFHGNVFIGSQALELPTGEGMYTPYSDDCDKQDRVYSYKNMKTGVTCMLTTDIEHGNV